MKLRIPRDHYIFLQREGALEEFVDAKLLGKEPEAKWLLKHYAKDHLDVLEDKLNAKKALVRERGIEVNEDGSLRVLKSPKGKVNVEDGQKYVLMSNLNKNQDKPVAPGPMKDLNFKKLPTDENMATFMTSE